MIQVTIDADIDGALASIDFARKEQLPFATALALTKTAQQAQRRLRNKMSSEYINRGGSLAFLMQGVAIDPATKLDLSAAVYDKDWFMAYQEEGGRKQAAAANTWERIRGVSIAGVRFPPSVTQALAQKGSGYFVNEFRGGGWFLGHRFRSRKDFTESSNNRYGGNPGFSVVMLLEKSVDVKPSLGMEETARQTTAEVFPKEFADAMEHAIATAKA